MLQNARVRALIVYLLWDNQQGGERGGGGGKITPPKLGLICQKIP